MLCLLLPLLTHKQTIHRIHVVPRALPPPRLCLMPLLSSHVRQGATVTGQAKPAHPAQECVPLGMSVQVSLRHPPKARVPWGTIVGEDSDSHVPKADSGIFARHRKRHCCVCANVAPTF